MSRPVRRALFILSSPNSDILIHESITIKGIQWPIHRSLLAVSVRRISEGLWPADGLWHENADF